MKAWIACTAGLTMAAPIWSPAPKVLFQEAHPRVMGMDASYSLPLKDGRSLWLFGDTLIGQVVQKRRDIQDMPSCTAAWGLDEDLSRSGGRAFSFFGGDKPSLALVVSHRPADRRHWPMAPFVANGQAHLAFVEIEAVGTGPYDFKVHGTGLAQAPLESDGRPALPFKANALRWAEQEPSFGAAVLRDRNWLYFYSGGAQTHLARVPAAQVNWSRGWRYWTGQAWGLEISKAKSVAASGAELGVRKAPGDRAGYWMCYVPPLGRQVMGRWAPRPEGPWGEEKALGPAVEAQDAEAIAYGAKWHPQLDSAQGVALTWNTNTPSEALARRLDLYWPRLVWLRPDALGPN